MAKKDFTLTSKILMTLLAAGDMFIITPHELRRRSWQGKLLGDGHNFYQMVNYLSNKGWIKYIDKNNQRFIKLTNKGQLEGLLAKAKLPTKPAKWDGKWRVVLFDIPKDSGEQRDFFRRMLKKMGFIKLQ